MYPVVRLPECWARPIVGLVAEAVGFTDQADWRRSRCGDSVGGGTRVGTPRWARILTITEGSMMAPIITKALSQ